MTAAALINIDVDDLGRAVSFYTSAFGLEVARNLGPSVVELLGAGAPIYLLEKAAGSAAILSTRETRQYRRHWTPVHLDFVVPQLETAIDAAVAAGATLEAPTAEHEWGRIAQFADPFGHGFCLIEFSSRGYDAIVNS
jgi:predicted enzyme related to lactoylglutathione lyase